MIQGDDKNDLSFLGANASQVAPKLLGCVLKRQIGDKLITVKIVEVEAYDQTDPASHTYNGLKPRSATMFGESGHLYVYFTYGMHYCCNIVTGQPGFGSGVLIRAVQPLSGQDLISQNRGDKTGFVVANGPGKLSQALAIDKDFNGHDLRQSPLMLIIEPPLPLTAISQTVRVGISKAKDTPWRFYITGNPYVSKK